MPYGFIQDVPGNEEMYRQIKAKLDGELPKGLVCHVALRRDYGLRYIDVWETQDDWERFRDEQVEPAVGEVLGAMGIPHDHSLVTSEDIEIVDVWTASTP